MRGLKGALINHAYLMRNKGFGFYILSTLATLVACFITDSPEVLMFAQAFLIFTVPLGGLEATQISFINKWNSFERCFGISPKFLILSRYAIFICISLLCVLIWRISPFYALDEIGVLFVFFVLSAQLTGIIYLPVMYSLNPNKKSAGGMIIMASMFGAILLAFFAIMQFEIGLWATVAIIAVLYVISATLSIFFDNIHRGRAN